MSLPFEGTMNYGGAGKTWPTGQGACSDHLVGVTMGELLSSLGLIFLISTMAGLYSSF